MRLYSLHSLLPSPTLYVFLIGAVLAPSIWDAELRRSIRDRDFYLRGLKGCTREERVAADARSERTIISLSSYTHKLSLSLLRGAVTDSDFPSSHRGVKLGADKK